MAVNKFSWSLLGIAFGVLVIGALISIALLAIVVDEIAEQELGVLDVVKSHLPSNIARQNSSGNEFTGEATAVLFGASSVPVGFDLISRTVLRHAPVNEWGKGRIRRANNLQRKYLMPFHTYLSIIALGMGILHLSLSSCLANPFPEWGLILAGILVTTGLLFKGKALPISLRKILYQFHTSLIVSGILLIILFVGHTIMETD